MSCGTITLGSSSDCDSIQVQPGTSATLRLLNFDDVISYSVNAIGKILSITLASGAQAYTYQGFRNDVKKSEEVVKGNQYSKFIHRFGFVIYDMTGIQKKNIVAMAKGRFVAIIESNGKTADSIELLGRDSGLSMDTGTIRDAFANGGLFVLNMSSAETEYERKLPQTLGTSYADAITIIDDIDGEEGTGIFDNTFDNTFS